MMPLKPISVYRPIEIKKWTVFVFYWTYFEDKIMIINGLFFSTLKSTDPFRPQVRGCWVDLAASVPKNIRRAKSKI